MAQLSKETSHTHFCGVGLSDPKNPWNIGAALRAAGAWGASFVAVEGSRWREHNGDFRHMDTEFARKRLPVFFTHYGVYLSDYVPYDCKVIGVERHSAATSIVEYRHPRRAFYVFGPEDGQIPDLSYDKIVSLPSDGSLNLAVAVNCVLFHRELNGDWDVGETNIKCPGCGSDHCGTNSPDTFHCNSCGRNFI